MNSQTDSFLFMHRLLPQLRRCLDAGAEGSFSTSPLPLGEIRRALANLRNRALVKAAAFATVRDHANERRRRRFTMRAKIEFEQIANAKARSSVEDAETKARLSKELRRRKAQRRAALRELNKKRRLEMLKLIV